MISAPQKAITTLLMIACLGMAGCRTDNAVKKDVKHGAKQVEKSTKKAADDVEKAVPGDSDKDGK